MEYSERQVEEQFNELIDEFDAKLSDPNTKPEDLIELKQKISELRKHLESDVMSTCSVWCEDNLSDPNNPKNRLKLFKYQKLPLDDTANRIICRWGRRSGKTVMIAARSIYKAATHFNYPIVFASGGKSQVDLFFDTILKLIKGTKLEKSIHTTKQPHYKLTFSNGSTIAGFVAGVGTNGSQADRIRGQSARLLVIDEMDLIPESALSEAIMPIANTINVETGEPAEFISSSTPKGKRGRFYQYCTNASTKVHFDRKEKKILRKKSKPEDDNGWVEYFFPSEINPFWTSIEQMQKEGKPIETSMEYRARIECGYEGAYKQEYLAEFSEDQTAVFQDKYLDDPRNVMNYDMDKLEPMNGNRYILGVDSNGPNIGAHMVILEYVNPGYKDQHAGRLRLHKKLVVGAEDYAQYKIANHIIQLDKKYKFEWVYLDQGYGNTIIERIRELHDLKMTTLADRLVSINFGLQMRKKNILTGEEETTYTKPFMVRSTAALLELGHLVFPTSEREPGGIINLMKTFFQEGNTKTGVPQYTEVNDHTIIAYMLAVLGYIMKMDHLFNAGSKDVKPVLAKANTINLAKHGLFRSRLITNDDADELDDWSVNVSRRVNEIAPTLGFTVRRHAPVGPENNLAPGDRKPRAATPHRYGRRLNGRASFAVSRDI
ncbi:MAG: terminase family protein [Candidatus Dojkabacteria bacterium]